MALLHITLLMTLLSYPLLIHSCTKYQHKIYVSSNGTNSTSCWKEGLCVSINLALKVCRTQLPYIFILEPIP